MKICRFTLVLFAAVSWEANRREPPPPGIRMNGTYAGQGGLEIEFHPESAMVSCGEAVIADKYAAHVEGDHVVVSLEHQGRTVPLAFSPDGKLTGSGPLLVNGRVITGQDARGELTYAPKSATCTLGVLTPGSGSAGSAAPAPSAAPPPSAAGPKPIAPAGNAVLSVTSAFAPGAASPIAGRPVFLMRDNFETTLTKSGYAIPGGMSAAKAMAAICQSGRTPQCQQALHAMALDTAAMVQADAAGRVTFPAVPAGTYYLWISAPLNDQPVTWNLPVVLKPGANSLTLDGKSASQLEPQPGKGGTNESNPNR